MKALRRGGPMLFLSELLVCVLVLAIASAVCARLFASAHALRAEAASLDMASALAQNAAEAFKRDGVFEALCFDEEGKPCEKSGAAYLVDARVTEESGLTLAEIAVRGATGAVLFTIGTARLAEVAP